MNKFIDFVAQSVSIRKLGWAFLLAWVFCVYYTGAVDGYVGESLKLFSNHASFGLLIAAFPVFTSVAVLLLIVALEHKIGSPCSKQWTFAVAPSAAALGTILIFCTPSPLPAQIFLFIAGSMLAGFGSALLWVMWGEAYTLFGQEDVELVAPISAVLAGLLTLFVSAMQGWVASAFVASFPLLAGWCLYLCWQDSHTAHRANASSNSPTSKNLVSAIQNMGRAGFGIFVACLIVCLEGSFWEKSSPTNAGLQISLIAGALFALLVGMTAVSGPRRVSLSFLYRWMTPALVCGFASMIFFESELGSFMAFAVSIAARFAFCLLTQMYFAQYVDQGKASPVQAYGLGWIFVHFGDLLGICLAEYAAPYLEAGLINPSQIAAVAMAVLVIAVMFVLNDSHVFSYDLATNHQRTYAEDVHGPHKEPFETSEGVCEKADATELKHTAEPLLEKGFNKHTKEHGCAQTCPIERNQAEHKASESAADERALDTNSMSARIQELAAEAHLTPRECEVFDLLAHGRSVPYIRDALVISRETAATHTKHIYAKLGVHSKQELIDLVEQQPVEPPQK